MTEYDAQQERNAERAAKQERDAEREVAARKAEKQAPIATRGPLPRTVSTLSFIPVRAHANYERGYDGNLNLAFLSADDSDSMQAYQSEIATGKLRVLPPGQTPALIEAAGRARETQAQGILATLNKHDADAKAAKRAKELAKAQASVNARFGVAS